MSYSTHSEAGYNHRNEDSIEVLLHPKDSGTLICLLADGQGGQAGGGEAARLATSKCVELAGGYPVKALLKSESWYEIFSGVDEAVNDDPEAGYTTLIGLCVSGDKVCGAACGDSAALIVGSRSTEILTEGQRKNPPLGSGAAYPVAFTAKLDGDAQLLLMSDGVWRFVGFDAIAELSRSYRGHSLIFALRELQLEQNRGILPDDFSLIVV